jgi:hypothetical protein
MNVNMKIDKQRSTTFLSRVHLINSIINRKRGKGVRACG